MQPYEQLEQEWAKFNSLDPRGMVACSSGTAALHLALEALQLPQGSEVLVPDFSMIACPRAVTLAGMTPVFVDCGEDLLMDVDLAVRDFLPWQPVLPMAVMMVHVYGRCCNVDKVTKYRERHVGKLFIVEDLAEAHEIRPHPDTDAACWSFYKNKIVAGEEGGAVWFRDPKRAALARQLRSLGFTEAHDFNHVPRGHNYRMSNLHADWILGNMHYVKFEGDGSGYRIENENGLDRVAINIERRREIEGWYDEHCPEEWRMPRRDAVWVYDVRLPFKGITGHSHGLYSDYVVRELKKLGVDARCGFKPMHVQEEYRKCRFVGSAPESGVVPFPTSHLMAMSVVYFHVRPGVTSEDECRRAMDALRQVVGPSGRAPGNRPDNQDGGRGEITPR